MNSLAGALGSALEALLLGGELDAHMIVLDHGPAEVAGANGTEYANEGQDDARAGAGWLVPVAGVNDGVDDEDHQGSDIQQHVRQAVALGRRPTRNPNRPVDEPG